MIELKKGKIAAAIRAALPEHPIVTWQSEEVPGALAIKATDPADIAAELAGKAAPSAIAVEGEGYFVCSSAEGQGRMQNKIAVITGSAQGFGKGIAEEMYKEGAYVAIADLNIDLAESVAKELGDRAFAVKVNVGDEASVAEMVESVALALGGVDIFVSNAGVLKAGGLTEMTLESFQFVTNINYTGFFLCCQYASEIMKAQFAANPAYTADIVQINSKSGLAGSNKNFAYAGGKFGGIGLTQSFAMELVPYGIKVNAVCPGNFYEGPLWSDPEKGLFVQYLKAGKVPGAKTVEDVKKSYVSKVPMNRGCYPADVARAIFYCVEQQYETGQAIPVTGGQIMLK